MRYSLYVKLLLNHNVVTLVKDQVFFPYGPDA